MIIRVEQVEVQERIREEIGEEDLVWLMKSFLALGQLQPIVLVQEDGKFLLDAGERRLIAARKLAEKGQAIKGLQVGEIRYELVDKVSPHVRLMREYDENDKRKDFTYIERAKFIRKFHEELHRQAKEAGAAWTNELTAATLRLSPATISYYLRIEEAVKSDPGVGKSKTLRSAIKRMKVSEDLRARQVEVKNNATEAYHRAESIATMGDAKLLIKEIPSESIDLVNFDPPWGDDTGHKSNDNWEGFDDDTETSDDVINSLLPELYRVLRQNRFIIFWYRTWAYEDMVARLEGTGFSVKFGRTPNIWFKPDKVSDQNRFPEKQLLDAYETFIIARKGEPNFAVQGKQNVFPYNRVPTAALIHPTEKPLDLCSDLVRLCSLPGESLLDPTAGSFSFVHAALVCGRKARGFDNNQTNYDRGLTRLAEYIKSIS